MSLSKPKRRKVDGENRQFQREWTEKYLFTLPTVMGKKPMCLLCSESIAVMKEYNVKRHYKSSHGSFSNSFPASFQRGQCSLSCLCTEQERDMIASLRVAWTLTRQKRHFTELETVKDCMLAVIDEMIVDEKVKESVNSAIQKVRL